MPNLKPGIKLLDEFGVVPYVRGDFVSVHLFVKFRSVTFRCRIFYHAKSDLPLDRNSNEVIGRVKSHNQSLDPVIKRGCIIHKASGPFHHTNFFFKILTFSAFFLIYFSFFRGGWGGELPAFKSLDKYYMLWY